MIPSIETIVEDLLSGKITKSQAVTWLNAHAEGAANDLRDHFAALAMAAYIQSDGACRENPVRCASFAYENANAMLKARKVK